MSTPPRGPEPKSKPVPPPRPVPLSLLMPSRYNDELFWSGFRRSAAVHASLVIIGIVAAVVAPRETVKFTPSIRVDLVALPDLKKSETPDLGQKVLPSRGDTKAEEKPIVAPPPKEAAPALAPAKPPTNEMALKKQKASTTKKAKGDNLDAAINNIRALEEIESQVNGKKKGPAQKASINKAKGNAVARGDSLTGTTGTDMNLYVSKMRDRLQDNWNLPVWLTTKNLSAQVMVFLDKSGFVNNLIIKQSSGNAQFDDYCIKTVRTAQPFGAPPDALVNQGFILGFPL